MRVYAVIGDVVGVGRVQHVIRAANRTAAWARFCRAYSRRQCRHRETRGRGGA